MAQRSAVKKSGSVRCSKSIEESTDPTSRVCMFVVYLWKLHTAQCDKLSHLLLQRVVQRQIKYQTICVFNAVLGFDWKSNWALLVPPTMTSNPTLKPEPLEPENPVLQMSLKVLAHERLCLSCWVDQITPYLPAKLRLIWWFKASFVLFFCGSYAVPWFQPSW